jgi:hypothetical protein
LKACSYTEGDNCILIGDTKRDNVAVICRLVPVFWKWWVQMSAVTPASAKFSVVLLNPFKQFPG